MKSQIAIALTLMVIILTSAYQSSAEGPSNGGGGNAGTSAPAQIREIVGKKQFRRQLADAFHRALWLARAEASAKEPALQIMGSLGPEKDLVDLIKEENIFSKDGDCISPDGEHKDASATADGVCFSTSRLTRIPTHALERSLIVLGLHEFSHLRGMNEEQALAIEKWFTLNKVVALPTEFEARQGGNIMAVASRVYDLIGAFKRRASDETICLRIWEIREKSALISKFNVMENDTEEEQYRTRYLPKTMDFALKGNEAGAPGPLINFLNFANCDSKTFKHALPNKELAAKAETLFRALKEVHPLFYDYTFSRIGMDEVSRKSWSYETGVMKNLNL